MRGRRLRAIPWTLAWVLFLAGGLAAGPATAEHAGSLSPADVIVIFRDGSTSFQRDLVLRRAGAVPTRHFQRVSAAAAHLPAPIVRAALEQDPEVLGLVPDRPMHVHRKPGGGSGGTGSGQIVPEGVKRIGGDKVQQTGSGVGVAVVDTGLDLSHADLPVHPTCFGAFTGSCQDDNGHGTHVGGIIAARNNSIDVVGVAPGATLYAVKVLDAAGSGSDSTVMAGLDWVADNGLSANPPIRVVNMSLGRPGAVADNPALHALITTLHGQGIAVVVSAGNDPSSEVARQVPATYPEVMAIASTTAVKGTNRCAFVSGAIEADTASYFTTDGQLDPTTGIGVTVSAPGEDREDIGRNCFIQSVGILSTRLGGGTTRMSGTSMAAPHVAGVVALMLDNQSALAVEELRSRIRERAFFPGAAPLDSPSAAYTFDGEREGVVYAPQALQ